MGSKKLRVPRGQKLDKKTSDLRVLGRFQKVEFEKKGRAEADGPGVGECAAVEFGGTRPEAGEYKTCVQDVAFVFPCSETSEKVPYY